MKELYIQSIFNQYMGLRDQSRADLEIYLTNPIGVGDHSDIGEEIKKKISEIDKYDSKIETMKRLFSPEESVPSSLPDNTTTSSKDIRDVGE